MKIVSYSIIINGQAGENFKPFRGLRQGDPLSSYLFLLCGEGLSCIIGKVKGKGKIKRISASKNGPKVSHFFFADDNINFTLQG